MLKFNKDLVKKFNKKPQSFIDKKGVCTIPYGVVNLEECMFEDIDKLTNIIIPDSVTDINEYAFAGCQNIVKVKLSENLTSIEEGVFYGCSNLTGITIPKKITNIDGYAFHACASIRDINIPENVVNIGEGAFGNCESLQNITIPQSVQNIEGYVFNNCGQLKNVQIPDGVTDIGGWTFHQCKKLQNVNIPQSVTSLGESSFGNCESLKNIDIPNSVTNISESAFSGCVSLESATLPQGLSQLSGYLFYNCVNLKDIVIPNSVTNIVGWTFADCKSLRNIIIPDKVTSIGGNSFFNCKNLRSVKLSKNLTNIEEYAFCGCENLQNITIPDSVKILGRSVFNNCVNMKKINICGKDVNVADIKAIKLFGDDQIREYFYANKYAKQLKPFIDKQIKMPVEILENLINQNILNSNKPFNCKHLINELDCMFKNEKKLLLEFEKSTLEEQIDFYKLAHKIGVFSNDSQVSQKASSAIVTLLKDKVFSIADFHKFFDTVDSHKPNMRVFEFLSNKNKNLQDIIYLENRYPKILSKIINNYDAFLECRTIIDHNGKPKKLSMKEAAVKLYTETMYANITPETKKMATEFAKFSLPQEHFNHAIELKKISDKQTNILNGRFKEISLIEQIENITNNTEHKIVSAQMLAKEFLEKKFTYEILNKQDPKNLILGAYCSCCANINSNYYGKQIAISSFTTSNVDNIVVKNTAGSIIAKGTIYVNRENGYAVINDFELNETYKKDGYKTDDKQLIFNTFKRAVNSFVGQYNKTNDKAITKVNVGLGYNRLAEYTKELPKETQLLKVPEQYGFQDAAKDQYTLYKTEEKVQ